MLTRAPSSIRHNLRASSCDAAAHGTMVGIGETYFAAFVLALGLGEIVAGMIASVPLIVGGAVQLASPWALKHWFTTKQWVVGCAALQAISFVPFIVAAIFGSLSAPAILLAAGFYWGTGLATGPAWNAWMGDLVPRHVRARYFSLRTRTAQLCVLVGFLAGGFCLQLAENQHWLLPAFVVLFSVAMCCRAMSSYFLSQQSEERDYELPKASMRSAVQSLRHSGGSKLLKYLIVAQAAIQFSGPYTTTFMLKHMQLGYLEYTGLLSAVYIAKITSLPLCGYLAKRLGPWRLLWLGGVGIAPISLGWALSQNLIFLTVLQVYSGVSWAAFELAFALLFFESIEQKYRTQVLTLYNFMHSSAAAIGATAGALFLVYWQASSAGYFWLFLLSGFARFGALIFLMRVPHWKVIAGSIGIRPLSVRPGAASTDAVVLASLPDQTEPEENHDSPTAELQSH